MTTVNSTASRRLFTVLNRIGPVEQPLVRVSKRGLPEVLLCWKFKQVQPGAESQLRTGIRSFAGDVEWKLEVRADQYCMIATPRWTGNRPLIPDEFFEAVDTSRETFHERVFGQVFAEVERMANHLANMLNASEVPEQEEGGFAVAYEEVPAADPDDAIHFVAWAVSDLQQFWNADKPWSQRGRNLDLGLTYREWDQFITELGKRSSDWPLLSRFEDPYMDVVFEPSEAPALGRECLSARAEFKEPAALRFLEKVRGASEVASANQVTLYYSAP